MKRFFVVFLLLICICYCYVFGDEKPSFSFTTDFSLMNGRISEFVFDEACKNTDNLVSRLNWDVKNIPVFNYAFDFAFCKHAFFGFAFKTAFPKASGAMQDYDWLNSIETSWHNDPPDQLTNYSYHDNRLSCYYLLGVSAGANIYLPFEFCLKPFAAYEFEYISFDAENGYKKYKADNFKKESFYGKVISYQQEINSFLLGLTVQTTAVKNLFFSTTFMLSPWLTGINALDRHFTRQVCFYDTPRMTLQLKADTKINYIIKDGHSLGINGFLQYIPLSKGDTHSKSMDALGNPVPGRWFKDPGAQGGTSRFLWSVGINYLYWF